MFCQIMVERMPFAFISDDFECMIILEALIGSDLNCNDAPARYILAFPVKRVVLKPQALVVQR